MSKKVMEQTYDQEFKVMLIGGADDDKTLIVYRYIDNIFKNEFTASVGGYVKFKTVVVDGMKVKLDVWDTAGDESYHTAAYYNNAKGVIVVYDVTDRESFEKAKKWIAIANGRARDALKMLVGNRCHTDERRAVTKKEGEDMAKTHEMKFFETSAKDDINIEEVFVTLAKDMKCERERKSAAAHRNASTQRQATSPVATSRQSTAFNAVKKTYDYLFKILLIGDSGCGKTEILFRFWDDAFNTQFISTIGIDFKIKTVDIDGKKIKLQIWDTAVQERFHTVTTSYYRGAEGIMLVYDIRNPSSLTNVEKLIENIEEHASTDVLKFLLGNRCHLEEERVVTKEQGENLAKAHGMKFVETSAKHNINIEEAFMTLARDLKCAREKRDEVQARSSANSSTSDTECTLL